MLIKRMLKKMKKIVLLILIIGLFFNGYTNNYSQTVRGYIVDRDTKMPIFGVNILIVETNPPQGASTDYNGSFKIKNVVVGRISLRLSCLGYETRTIQNITVGTGKEVFLNLEMQESLVNLNEVVISGGSEKGVVNNEMSLISARQVTVEETQRFAGSLDDPSRMVSAFAGVTSDPQGNNDIVVRGNSPKGILWKMEGIDIPNPNHFSDESTTGGPINALSSNMLANSDFFTGAFAPEYGNAISGIFDVKMRTGNNEKPEFTIGVGALGVDLAAEGPFSKGYDGSYLFNYRYSSLALLDNLGAVDFGGVPKYQDLAFKVNLPTKGAGSFTLFGLGGMSGIDDEYEDTEGIIRERNDYSSHMGTVGLLHFYHLSANTYLKTSVSGSANGSKVKNFELRNSDMMHTGTGHWNKTTLRVATAVNHKFNSKHRLLGGVNYDHFIYDMDENYIDDEDDIWKNGINLNENAGLLQAFATWKYRITPEITMVGGLHYTQFMLNDASALEPRLAINWQPSANQIVSFGYGQHSMVESIITYYGTVYNEEGVPEQPNVNLDLTKSDHYILGYQRSLSKKLVAKVELYYQNLHSVPVENIDTSYFSLINKSHGYVDKALVSKGKGYNYGLEFTLERYFFDSYYFMVTASVFDSKYKASDGKWRNTKYNASYAANFLIGKEFTIGKPEKGNKLNINAKFFVNGGNRYVPLDLEKSRIKGSSVYKTDEAYNSRLDNVYQMNFTAGYSINRPKVRHEIYLDIYNVLGNQARINEYYDEYKDDIDYGTQLNMIPNIMYKIHF
jgi:carboxypeptidase-like protein